MCSNQSLARASDPYGGLHSEQMPPEIRAMLRRGSICFVVCLQIRQQKAGQRKKEKRKR